MNPDPDAIREAGEIIRAHLLPLWRRLHEADLAFQAIRALPDPLSTALCRHTTLFALRAFSAASWDGWRAVDGAVVLRDAPIIPDYAAGSPRARHCWLSFSNDLWLDLAADQFGLDPVLAAAPRSDPFRRHEPTMARPPLGTLLRTVGNWEGDSRGSWREGDLATIREGYGNLLTQLRRLGRP